ncbi:hypothetical protein AKJ16_DCAP24099 [Drosera capensis]
MCTILEENAVGSVQAYAADKSAVDVGKKILPQFEEIASNVSRVFASSSNSAYLNVEELKPDAKENGGTVAPKDQQGLANSASGKSGKDTVMTDAEVGGDTGIDEEEPEEEPEEEAAGVIVLDD